MLFPCFFVAQEFGDILNLSWMQRLTLFVMCFSAGAVMIGLSFAFLPMILLKPHKFAAAFTAGNLLAIMRYVPSPFLCLSLCIHSGHKASPVTAQCHVRGVHFLTTWDHPSNRA